jgi:hypothetical protein
LYRNPEPGKGIKEIKGEYDIFRDSIIDVVQVCLTNWGTILQIALQGVKLIWVS